MALPPRRGMIYRRPTISLRAIFQCATLWERHKPSVVDMIIKDLKKITRHVIGRMVDHRANGLPTRVIMTPKLQVTFAA
jgi:hypothetical protein